jgi:chromosome segregation ATPase
MAIKQNGEDENDQIESLKVELQYIQDKVIEKDDELKTLKASNKKLTSDLKNSQDQSDEIMALELQIEGMKQELEEKGAGDNENEISLLKEEIIKHEKRIKELNEQLETLKNINIEQKREDKAALDKVKKENAEIRANADIK